MTGFDDDDIDALDYLEENDPVRQQWESARNTVIDKISESLLNLQEQYKARQKWKQAEKKLFETHEPKIIGEVTKRIVSGVTDKEISTANEEILIAKARQAFMKSSDSTFFYPKIWTNTLMLGTYLNKEKKSFSDWKRQMILLLGHEVNPWLNPIWETLLAYPEVKKFDEELITLVAGSIGNIYISGYGLGVMRKVIIDEFGEEIAKQLATMINSIYTGVQAYFKRSAKKMRK